MCAQTHEDQVVSEASLRPVVSVGGRCIFLPSLSWCLSLDQGSSDAEWG